MTYCEVFTFTLVACKFMQMTLRHQYFVLCLKLKVQELLNISSSELYYIVNKRYSYSTFMFILYGKLTKCLYIQLSSVAKVLIEGAFIMVHTHKPADGALSCKINTTITYYVCITAFYFCFGKTSIFSRCIKKFFGS